MKNFRLHKMLMIWIISILSIQTFLVFPPKVSAAWVLQNDRYRVEIGQHGEIFSLTLPGDLFPTEYVMNTSNSSFLNSTNLHLWVGQVMFRYRFGDGPWLTAWTSQSADIRTITQEGNTITVTYDGQSVNPKGIRDFKVVEKYELVDDGQGGYVRWSIEVTNTSSQTLEIGDFGLPLPFYEQWVTASGLTETYEQRVLVRSYVGNHSSFITVGRPSGLGDFIIFIPDDSTGAQLEYQDRWKAEEYPSGPENLWANNDSRWIKGLNVYYIHSQVIKSTNKGYLPNTSLFLGPGESKTYAFKFVRVSSESDVKEKLYQHGLVDVTVVPSMIVPTDLKAKVALRSKKPIVSYEAQYPDDTTINFVETKPGDYYIYEISLKKLGHNNITFNYGNNEKITLQFYAIEPIADALQRHSTFMVEKMQWNLPGDIRDKVFDDWMMHTKSRRNNFAGYWGWGDDWGYTKGEFLAEKNVLTPVPSEIEAVDQYLHVAIWNTLMKDHQQDYLIHDFLMPEPNTTPTYRGYAYPHIYNTYFSMYKISKLYPDLVDYIEEPRTYLLRAYNIFKALYEGPVAYNWNTGLMGESTTPELIAALREEGFDAEADDILNKMVRKFNNFKNQKYPYGSEYNYDNTGEEAVYTLAKMFGDTNVMNLVKTKTRSTRGWMPVWYLYGIPVTITGENWWNGQYSASLAGIAIDDWVRHHSTQPEVEQRLSWAAKIANVAHINSGQINSDPENIGAVAWTYQAEKGNFPALGLGGGPLQNGWRGMSGEAGLGLWGAIRILSADIAVDPIFGLVGYGADVTEENGRYTIIPKDGIFQRLNLITEKFRMELQRDKYTTAIVSKTKDYVKFTLRNVTPGFAHTTKVTFRGLKPASYDVTVDGQVVGRLNAFGAEAVVNIPVGGAETYEVELLEAEPYPNEAPAVNAGEDSTVTLPDPVALKGTVNDDGLPFGTLTLTWSVVSAPEGAEVSFANANAARTTATVSLPGTYVFKLTASDGELSAEDTVTVTVLPKPPLPELIAYYKFNETNGTSIADSSGNENHAFISGGATWVPGKIGNALNLPGGSSNAYVRLPNGIVRLLDEMTIAAWVKVTAHNTWARIFDFGSGSNTYMFLAPQGSGSQLRFAISTSGNQAEERIDGPALPAGVWKHVAVTLSGKTGILYVDGVEVARNENMTLKPSDLGNTTNNYIGRSQFPDPYFNGLIDEFKIFSRALSPEEIAQLANLPVSDIVSVDEVQVTTSAMKAPVLPPTVRAWLQSGESMEVDVIWDPIDPAQYAEEGSFTVRGTIPGANVTAVARVTVTPMVIDPYPTLVLRYNFDEGSGTTVYDASGNGHDGRIVGNLQWVADGYRGGALRFSGSGGNYVDMGTSRDLQPSSITVSYWIKRTQQWTGENMVLWFKPEGNWSGNGFFLTYNGNSNIMVVDGTDNFYVPINMNTFLPLNEWTHVVVTFDSSTKKAAIYKNGVAQPIATSGTPSSITSTTSVKKLGVSGYGNGAQLNAVLDDLRIYAGAMTADQVRKLYEGRDVVSVQPVSVTTVMGVAPTLPRTVTVTYETYGTGNHFVAWDPIDPSQYATPGTFTVFGRVDGTNIPAVATVTVSVPPLRATLSGPETAVRGQQVDWTVGVTGVTYGFTALDVIVRYDPSKLEFDTVTDDTYGYLKLAPNAIESLRQNFTVLDTAVRPADGQVRVIMASSGEAGAVTTDGNLFVLRGRVKADAAPGSTTVRLSDFQVSRNGEPGTVELSQASLTLIVHLADKTALNAVIAEAQALYDTSPEGTQPGQYPPAAKAMLRSAIDAAIAVRDNPASTQVQVDTAVAMLQNAMTAFRNSVILPPPPSPPANVDKSALKQAIAAAQSRHDKAVEGTKVGQYRSGAKAALAAAIQAAVTVRDNAWATQADVDAATAALNEAVRQFQAQVVTLVEGATQVSIRDLAIVAKFYGATSADPNWSQIAKADLFDEGRITLRVLAAIARMILVEWATQ